VGASDTALRLPVTNRGKRAPHHFRVANNRSGTLVIISQNSVSGQLRHFSGARRERTRLAQSRALLDVPEINRRTLGSLICVAGVNRYTVPIGVLYAEKMMAKKRFIGDLSCCDSPTD